MIRDKHVRTQVTVIAVICRASRVWRRISFLLRCMLNSVEQQTQPDDDGLSQFSSWKASMIPKFSAVKSMLLELQPWSITVWSNFSCIDFCLICAWVFWRGYLVEFYLNTDFFFFEVLGFELRAYTSSHSANPFFVIFFLRWGLLNHLPQLASTCTLPDLCLFIVEECVVQFLHICKFSKILPAIDFMIRSSGQIVDMIPIFWNF
jgi:hypothetical protein